MPHPPRADRFRYPRPRPNASADDNSTQATRAEAPVAGGLVVDAQSGASARIRRAAGAQGGVSVVAGCGVGVCGRGGARGPGFGRGS